MSSILSNFQIVQNEALGAHVIWEFSRHYNMYNPKHEYAPLLLTLPLLPIVYNYRARQEIQNRQFKGGSLLRTIAETGDVYSGLQGRMESMVDLTMRSINNSIHAGLIDYDKIESSLIPRRKTALGTEKDVQYGKEYDEIVQSSRRIGAWFGQLEINEIMTYFNITF